MTKDEVISVAVADRERDEIATWLRRRARHLINSTGVAKIMLLAIVAGPP